MRTEPPRYYLIQVEGVLDNDWAMWFEGMTLTTFSESPNETTISGFIADQTALFGILERIRNLNLQLVMVTLAKPKP